MHDMYEAPPDLFVAGLAGGSKGVAVFSFARYDPRDSQIRKIPDFVLLLGQILFSILMLCLDFRVRQNDLDQVLLVPFFWRRSLNKDQAKLLAFLPTLKVHQ